MADKNDEELQKQVYESMNQKSTDELIRIWKDDNHQAYTNEALLIVQQILLERLGSLPAREGQNEGEIMEIEDEEVERTSNSLIWVSSLSAFVSWAFLAVMILIVGFNIYSAVSAGPASGLGLNIGSAYTVLNWLLLLGVGVSLFLVLQFVSKAIFVLLDIFDNSSAAAAAHLESRSKE